MKYLLVLLILLPLVSAAQFTYERTDDPELLNKCFFEPTNFSRYLTVPTTNIAQDTPDIAVEANPNNATADDLVYGQVLDDEGDPLGGVMVKIIWFYQGEERFFTTTTLTRQSALLFGDENFEGYYIFNRARIGGATYRVELAEETPVQQAPAKQEPTEQTPVITPLQDSAQPDRRVVPTEPKPFIDFLEKYIGWILLLLVLTIIVILYQWKFKKNIGKLLFQPPRLSRSVKRLNQQLVKNFMQTDFPTIDIDSNFRALLAKIVQDKYCFVEKEGRFLGLITAEDVLEPLYKEKKTNIRDLLTHPNTLTPQTPFGRAAMLGAEYRVLPVVKNGVVVGVVTRDQLLTMYDELFSLNPSAVKLVSKLQHAITQAVTISPYDSVEALIERMIAQNTSTVVIVEDKPTAIITELHVLEELMDYRDTLHDMSVSSFGGRLVTVEATDSLLDANRILLDAGLRAVPVTHKAQLVGVLTQRSVMNELQIALKDYV